MNDNSIVAVAMKTESGDDYLYLYTDVQCPSGFVHQVGEDMGDELAYVWSVDVECSSAWFNNEDFKSALVDHIDGIQED